MGERFEFRRLTPADLPRLHAWLNRPHVAEWWGGPIAFTKLIVDYQEHMVSSEVFGYIVYRDGVPMAYAQCYHAAGVDEAWWPDEPAGTWGIDQALAHGEELGRGIGTRMVKAFGDFVFAKHGATGLITDPSPDNPRAIRCYEKAGFTRDNLVQTPDGPAILLRRAR